MLVCDLFENADMVQITPQFIAAVRRAGDRIAWDIADDWTKDDGELAVNINELLKTMHVIGGIGQTMILDRSELRPKQLVPNGITSVGCHWCWGSGAAAVYHHDNAYEDAEQAGYKRKDLIEITLVATVKFEDVDWPYTIATNFIHPGEQEVTIKDGATVMLDYVWVKDKEIEVGRPVGATGFYDMD